LPDRESGVSLEATTARSRRYAFANASLPKLLRVLRPYRDAAAKERKAKPGTLRSAVEAELLLDGKAKAENVAEALVLSLRRLPRTLAEEATTYGEVVD
jgi:hypothetical protein